MWFDDLTPVAWPLNAWYIMTIISVPVYLIVVICLIRLRLCSKTYNTTFYTILLQHSFADLLTSLFFFSSQYPRNIQIIREFYFEYQHYYIAPATYNSIYYFLYVRCSGIMLLSFQRYLIIASPTAKFTQIVQEAKNWKIVVVYWTIPTLISLIVLKDVDITFDNLENMSIVVDKSIIARNTLMALIVTSVTCIFCTTVYLLLFYYIRTHTANLISKSLRREMHLAVQVFILLIGLFGIFLYYSFQNYFSKHSNAGPIYFMRSLYPLPNGILSYLNPFCILFLNRDLARQVWRSARCAKLLVSDVRASTLQSTSNRPAVKITKVRAIA
ncbi:unnamed protein product [Caenorhabditis angaria]|uniref:G-protein coupled receptors family 1 profile domain-containing protein n=1 Tax=Caenorhabditis angaria TaxID=860376 RepID=A0A9P1ILK3_9PELO|nr:unnamed protein product [Caenorhabditis angaria]